MTLAIWLTVVSICLLGAMSPGPSLAVVLQQTLRGGRKTGLIAAITHGLGIGLYALLCISGIAVMITASPLLFTALQWLGAIYLLWLGIKGLRAKSPATTAISDAPTSGSAARDGFLVVEPFMGILLTYRQKMATCHSKFFRCGAAGQSPGVSSSTPTATGDQPQ